MIGGGGTASAVVDNNATCFGACDGQATGSILIGGTAPFTYLWDDGLAQTTATAIGLCAGTYGILITDAGGCSSAASVVITEPPAVNAAVTITNDASCNGVCDGDATVSASGGTGTYTYSWSPTGGTGITGTGLCAGTTYTVTVEDANGCATTATTSITEPTAMVLTIVPTDPLCVGGSDGSADLTVTGGTAPYNYLWTGSITSEDLTNIADGNYSVTVTDDNGCTATANTSITDPVPVTIAISVIDASCGLANGTACATPSGGLAPYTYAWNDTLFQTTTCALTVPGGSYGVTVTDANGCIATGNAVVNDLPGSNATALVVSNASAFSVCDGEASASMPGTAPFTYLWDDGLAQTTANAIGLCAGTYCVTVTDAVGCSDSACIIITEPNAMTIAIVTTDNNCFGDCNGTATVTVVGGSTPYTFLWTGPNSFASSSQDLIGLCAGTYDVTLTDANSISITDQVIITEPAAVTAGVTGVDVTCNGLCDGTATVVAGGGTPPYTYLWDDGFNQTTVVASVLCALGYNVTVTDAFGCMATGSVTINEPPAIVVNLTPTPATCGQADGAISAAVSNGTPAFTYTWDISCSSSGCTGLAAGTYSVTVTDADGCLGTGTGNVANTGGPTVGMTDSVNVNCFGGNDGSATAAVADGTPPYTYAWNTAPVQTTLIAAGLFAGSYCILVTDVNGCVTSVCVSLSEPPQLVAVAAGTDPSCNGGTDGLVSASVTGGIGPYTYAWTGTGGCITPICGSLGDGTYNLTVTDANGCTATSSATLVEPTVLAMLITGVDVSCGGLCDGSANVVATGGTTPYTYSWSNGDIGQIADSLCAATVNLSITDANGCLAASSVVISEPTPVVVTIPSYGDIDCFGNCNGFAQSSVTGGVSPYTYSWNTSSPNDQIVGLCSGVYSVTVADNNGCTGTESVTITEPPAMTLSLTSQNVSCYGYCDGTATVTATGGVGPYFYLWDDNTFQTTMAATNLCAGPYSVVVTDSKGCSGTTTVVLIEPQEITITGTPVASTCGYQNGSACVVVTGGILPYTIQWNDPDQTIGNCIDSVYAGVYGVCLFDGNGCSFCISLTINDITGPMIDSVVTNDLLCFGDGNGTATVYPSGGTLPYTYFWQNLAGDTIGLNTNILFGLSGGTYSVAVSDVNTCLYAQTFSIAEPVQIASAITSSSDALCYGDCNGSATVAVGNGTQPYTYSWVPSGGSTPNATGLCAGMNNVLIIDANGCQTNNGTLINEPTELIPSMVGTDISCNGGSDGEITVTVTGGSIPYNYQWLPGGTGTGITVSNLGAGAYTVIITDINGCDTNQTMSIIDPAPLSVTGGSTPSSCGDPNGQAYVSVNGGTPPYTYSWFDGGGIPIGQTTDTATGLIQGAYQCLIEDYNGCSFSLPVSVNDNAGPVVTYESSTDVLCFGTATGEASVNVTGTPPYSYMWEDGQQTKIATGLASGTYTVTVTDVNGCTDSVDVTINEPPEIILVMSGATTICVGGQTQLSVSASGGVPPYSYDWDNVGYTSSSTLDVSPTDTTTYSVNVQDANGCIVSGSVEVQVYPPLVGIVSDPFICEGDDLTLTASGSGGMGVPANYVYTWLDAGKNIVFTGNPYVVQGLVTGVYTYYVALSDACPGDTTMITATVSPEPPPPVVAADAVYCFGDPMIDLNAQGQNISWYTDALLTPPPVDTGADFTPSGAVGTTTYYATQTVNGCESPPGTATVVVNPLPTAGFYPFPEEAPITNPGIVFTDNASPDVVSWLWFFGDGDSAIGNLTDFFNGDTVVHIYSDSGTFVVYQIVTNSFGCKDIAIDTIEITNEYILFAPLAFTPGGDNINDYFLPRGMGISDEKFRFYVYDRWGDLIYQHDGAYSEWLGWDGKANDGKERAQQDVYVWLIRTEDLDENAHEYVGHVTLLR